MTDRLDARIRALVVEMLDQPPEPPEFPYQDTTVTARPREPWTRRRKLLFLLFASLAAWSLVLAPIYALAQLF